MSPLPPWPDEEEKAVPLSALHEGEKGIVVELLPPHRSYLLEIGFEPGAQVRVAEKPAPGYLTVWVKGTKLALGRGMGEYIRVRREKVP